MKLQNNKYGFIWGECTVERTAASEGKERFFQVLRVFAPNGEIVEIVMTKRKTRTQVIPKVKEVLA